MSFKEARTRLFAAGTALGLVTVALAAAPAEAAEVKTVKVTMSDSAITFRGGGSETANGVTMLRSGRYHFRVRSAEGAHALQLARFNEGYTLEQAQKDFQSAFEGDVAAVQRIDTGMVFLGGASARPNRPGHMVLKLGAGHYAALDQNSPVVAMLHMVGTAPKQPKVAFDGTYTAFTHGWHSSRGLPASGMVRFRNQSDQPHFLVLQQVKDSTTKAQVRRFVNRGLRGQPSWALKAFADSGVVSPGKNQLFRYDLPPGKYVIACFWPDYFTGTPHVVHGMWDLVRIS